CRHGIAPYGIRERFLSLVSHIRKASPERLDGPAPRRDSPDSVGSPARAGGGAANLPRTRVLRLSRPRHPRSCTCVTATQCRSEWRAGALGIAACSNAWVNASVP